MNTHRRMVWAYLRWLRRRMESIVAISLVIGMIILIGSLYLRTTEKRTAIEKANAVADPILSLCLQGGETAHRLAAANLCQVAADVKVNPTSAESTSRGLDEPRIIELIRAELAKQPQPKPAEPSMDQLIRAAGQVVTAHPELFRGEKGDPGPPPTPGEIASAVSAYIRNNPNMFRGEDGKDGRDGRDGAKGDKGDPGDSFAGLRFEPRNGVCMAIVSTKTQNGIRETVSVVPDTLCFDPTPSSPTTEPSPTTESPPPSTSPSSEPLLGG